MWVINLAGKWIYELAECESLKRASDDARKSFITSRVDRYRKPFGRKHSAGPLSQRPSDSRDTGREQGLAYAAGFQFQGRSSWTVVPGSFTRTMTSAR